MQLTEHSFDIVAEGQMKGNAHNNKQREVILDMLKNSQSYLISLNKILNKIEVKRNMKNILKHPRSSIKRILKIIFTK